MYHFRGFRLWIKILIKVRIFMARKIQFNLRLTVYIPFFIWIVKFIVYDRHHILGWCPKEFIVFFSQKIAKLKSFLSLCLYVYLFEYKRLSVIELCFTYFVHVFTSRFLPANVTIYYYRLYSVYFVHDWCKETVLEGFWNNSFILLDQCLNLCSLLKRVILLCYTCFAY